MFKESLYNIIKESFEDVITEVGYEIELLSNASWQDIELEAEEYDFFYRLSVFVNGEKIKSINKFWCEYKPKYGAYQLNIELPNQFRNKGVATKLYMAFLKKCGNIISFINNRNSAYAHLTHQEKDFDIAIPKLLDKVGELSGAKKEILLDKQTNEIVAVILSEI